MKRRGEIFYFVFSQQSNLFLQKHSANGGCRRTEFYCEECGKNIYSYNGLMVR